MRLFERGQIQSCIGDVTGAFADGALLFPLIVALVLKTGMDAGLLLASAGAAYIIAGIVFRVPMAVQPLKSVVIAGLAAGAGADDIRWSGFAVGAACLLLSFCNVDRFVSRVPAHLVHGLQMALGILLIMKGIKDGFAGASGLPEGWFLIGAGAVIAASSLAGKPLMGWIAAAGLSAGLFFALRHPFQPATPHPSDTVDLKMVLSLAVPQLVLTLANSVIGTADVARRYFGEAAYLVTPKRLLTSIGIGNIVAAPFGGLPFCHGAGGVTAHYRGGARTSAMNMIIGSVLLALAAASHEFKIAIIPEYPKALMAMLLVATGWFHLWLAKPSWNNAGTRWILIVMGIASLWRQDMLWVLVVGVACEAVRKYVINRNEGKACGHDILR